jgi:hypothetical protein
MMTRIDSVSAMVASRRASPATDGLKLLDAAQRRLVIDRAATRFQAGVARSSRQSPSRSTE